MRDLFVSDLHLQAGQPGLLSLFDRLMADLAPQADRLFILGDLFEYWIGDDGADVVAEHVARGTREFAERGGSAYFMAGNRDFLVGANYAREAGLRLLADPATVTLPDGRIALLSHGDRFCLDDAAYAAFYREVRDPAWQEAFLAQPLEEREAFAQQARAESKAHGDATIGDVDVDAVHALMAERGVNTLIHGHTHRPAVHVLSASDLATTRVVLADWRETGSALWADSDGLRFEEFS